MEVDANGYEGNINTRIPNKISRVYSCRPLKLSPAITPPLPARSSFHKLCHQLVQLVGKSFKGKKSLHPISACFAQCRSKALFTDHLGHGLNCKGQYTGLCPLITQRLSRAHITDLGKLIRTGCAQDARLLLPTARRHRLKWTTAVDGHNGSSAVHGLQRHNTKMFIGWRIQQTRTIVQQN